ncbi:hypothetical protein E4L96_11495 [Massilia arenosa]|uniref:Lipoprotein n=1 Tax=Zemynaea arenosa TaxID=2561931 RepID=A0A4Y9SBQ6_9BURK|nr:hypothetical protein [Massilia arenosa]TFW19758.1 hypothetical protein E4L96_11495 [Massilia arenosa]
MRRVPLTLAAALLPTVLLCGCAARAQDQNAPAVQEASYPLSQGSTATLAPNVVVTLDSVNDSRCPKNVMCVRKGDITYSFTLTAHGRAEKFTLTPDQPTYTPSGLPGVSLTMDGGDAPAPARDADPTPAHNVTLQVARRNQ